MRPLGVIRVIRGWFVFVLLPKGSGNIAEDVFDGLTTYAEANKTIADRVAAPASSPLCSGMDATEARRLAYNSKAAQELFGARTRAEVETDDAPEGFHLAFRNLVSRVVREAGIKHGLDTRLGRQKAGEL